MVNDVPIRRRPGRPQRSPTEGVRIQQSLRMRPRINEEIRMAAERNFRSISEELESRVDQSCECIIVDTKDELLRDKIRASALKSGRSQIQEVHTRLHESLLMDDLFGSRETYALLMLLASDIKNFEEKTTTTWQEAAEVEAASVINSIVDMIKERFFHHLSMRAKHREYADLHRRLVEDQEADLPYFNP